MNTPKIRFKGFTDDWEQRKFSDCYKMSSGYAFKMSDYCDEGVGLINGESIQHGIINDDNLNHLPEFFIQQYPEFLLKENDIVVGLNRPITNGNLKIARIPSKYNDSLLYQRAGKIVYKTDCDKDFTYVLLSQEILKHTLVEAVGSDQPFISTSKLDGWKMMMPSNMEEQVKIGEYFQNLDHLITLHQRKCDETKQLKKFMLQKMFPKNGEKNPEIRFKGFTDDWEQRKVGEVTKELLDYDNFSSGLPLLTSSRSGLMYQSEYRGNATTENENTLFSVVPLNACTYRHMSDDSTFHLNINTLEKGLVSKEYPVFQENESNLKFIVQYINSSNSFTKFCTEQKKGGTRTRLYYKTLCEYKLMMPSIKEQNKTANFFDTLDHLITLHQRKCEKLKELKKFMLQNMFV